LAADIQLKKINICDIKINILVIKGCVRYVLVFSSVHRQVVSAPLRGLESN
jgi:hypothetical protein